MSGYCSAEVPAKSQTWCRVNPAAWGCTPSVSSNGIVMASGAPQPGCVDQQVHPRTPGELLVPGGVDVADGGDGDVGVDMKRCGASRPVARAFLPGDGPPWEGRAVQA